MNLLTRGIGYLDGAAGRHLWGKEYVPPPKTSRLISLNPPENSECGICFDKFLEGTEAIAHRPQKGEEDHIFHKKCIEDWTKIKSICPTDRVHISLPNRSSPSFIKRIESKDFEMFDNLAVLGIFTFLGGLFSTITTTGGSQIFNSSWTVTTASYDFLTGMICSFSFANNYPLSLRKINFIKTSIFSSFLVLTLRTLYTYLPNPPSFEVTSTMALCSLALFVSAQKILN